MVPLSGVLELQHRELLQAAWVAYAILMGNRAPLQQARAYHPEQDA